MSCPKSQCPAQRHDVNAYRRGGCRCHAGRAADRRYRARYEPEPLRVPAVGTGRRIRALQRLGYGFDDIAAITGCGRQTLKEAVLPNAQVTRLTADAITVAYDRLSLNVTGVNDKAAKIARTKGWHGPWCWTEHSIDDAAAQPLCTPPKKDGKTYVDVVAVQRFVAGHSTVDTLNGKEKRAAIRLLIAAGWTKNQITQHIGCNHRLVQAALAEAS